LFFQQSDDLFRFREASGLFFGKDQLAVCADFKDAAAGLDQFFLDGQLPLDSFDQTSRFGQVVSLSAVFDFHFHPFPP